MGGNPLEPLTILEIKMAEEETFKVDTGDEPDEVKVEEDDNILFDTSTGKGMENVEIPEKMRAPVFEGGR